MNQFAFKKGWDEAKGKYQPMIKKEIMERLRLETNAAFYQRRRGVIEHRITEAGAIIEVFKKYGVPQDKVWGE